MNILHRHARSFNKDVWNLGLRGRQSAVGFPVGTRAGCCAAHTSELLVPCLQWSVLSAGLPFRSSTSTSTWTAAWPAERRRTASGGEERLPQLLRACSPFSALLT